MNLLKAVIEEALMCKDPGEALQELHDEGLLRDLFPEVLAIVGFGGNGHKDLWGHTKKVVAQTIRVPHLRWAALFHDVGKPRCFSTDTGEVTFHHHEVVGARMFRDAMNRTRLLSDAEVSKISFIIEHLGHVEAYESSWTESAVRRLYVLTGDSFEDICALSRADITTRKKDKRMRILHGIRELRDRVQEMKRLDAIPAALPKGLGTAITERFGIPPSKELGDVMGQIKKAVETGDLPRQAPIETLLEYYDRNLRR